MASSLTVTAHTQQTLDRLNEACPSITAMLDNKKAEPFDAYRKFGYRQVDHIVKQARIAHALTT
jgi:hypothetical protein